MNHLFSRRHSCASRAVGAFLFALGLLGGAPLLIAFSARGQSIQTLVGGGSYDGWLATAVGLALPSGVAVDAAGGVFLVDTSARRVLRIDDSTGIVSTVAGNGGEDAEGDGGPAKKAALGLPKGICLDGSGNVFIAVASRTNSRIWRVDAATRPRGARELSDSEERP
jgi:hypothetical protein